MEHYYTVDKFNRGFSVGRSGEGGGGGGGISKEEVDEKIRGLLTMFNKGVGTVFNDIKDRVQAIEEVGKLYSVTNTYFSTKGRRIVGAKPAIDETDVIIRKQLDAATEKLNNKISDLQTTLTTEIEKLGLEKTDVIVKKQLDAAIEKVDNKINDLQKTLKTEIEKYALVFVQGLSSHYYSWGDNVYNLKDQFDKSLSGRPKVKNDQ